MIQQNELRIGNLIHFTFINEAVNVLGINAYERNDGTIENKLSVKEGVNLYCEPPRCFKPIPLTEEWLNKFSFGSHFTSDPQERNASKAHYISDFKIHQLDEEVESFGFGGNDYEFLEIKTVHQLQNLYFALTGEELTIKN